MKQKWTLKRVIQFCCLCGAGLMYYVPYGFSIYYDTFIEAFGVSNAQLGAIQSAYTVVSMFTYFFGGLVADKFSARKLLVFSYVGTAALTFWFGMFPAYAMALLIMGLMGFINTVTFYSAMMKGVRIFAGEGNEGMGMGWQEAFRCLVASGASILAMYLFSRSADDITGLRNVIWLFAAAILAIGILSFIFLERDVVTQDGDHNLMNNLKICFKDVNIWLISLIVACLYMSNVAIRFMTPFATSIFGITVLMGAVLGNFREYMRPFGAFAAGSLSTRVGITKAMFIFSAIFCVLNYGLAFMPQSKSLVYVIFIMAAVGWIVLGAMRGLYFAPIGEANISMAITGTAVGIIATIGYIPDAVMPMVYGKIIDSFPPERAYPIIFTIAGTSILLGLVLMLVFMKRNKKSIAALMEKKRQEAAGS